MLANVSFKENICAYGFRNKCTYECWPPWTSLDTFWANKIDLPASVFTPDAATLPLHALTLLKGPKKQNVFGNVQNIKVGKSGGGLVYSKKSHRKRVPTNLGPTPYYKVANYEYGALKIIQKGPLSGELQGMQVGNIILVHMSYFDFFIYVYRY